MRVYGRIPNPAYRNGMQWVVVETDENGFNDEVYLTAMCQMILLNYGESPFYANRGIPAQQAVLQQVAPDLAVAAIQQYFAPFFASVRISRGETPVDGVPQPTYFISVTTNQGFVLTMSVIPQ